MRQNRARAEQEKREEETGKEEQRQLVKQHKAEQAQLKKSSKKKLLVRVNYVRCAAWAKCCTSHGFHACRVEAVNNRERVLVRTPVFLIFIFLCTIRQCRRHDYLWTLISTMSGMCSFVSTLPGLMYLFLKPTPHQGRGAI